MRLLCLSLASLLAVALRAVAAEPPWTLSRNGDIVEFRGVLVDGSVGALVAELRRGSTQALIISSPGGDVVAAKSLGLEVHRLGLAVRVRDLCGSSCANYVFTAAASRRIEPNAVVGWHGNVFQKDLREMLQCGRLVSSLSGDSMAAELPSSDMKAQFAQMQEAELAFFRTVGVDEYLARVGQEPVPIGDFTLTVEDMARLGLRGVQAAPDYGTEAFCARVRRDRPEMALHCVRMTDEMLAHERARRERGETCRPDGTLRTRQPGE